jgi:hypothetical protein
MRSATKAVAIDFEPPRLSKADRAELNRRRREMMDPTRYVVVSPFFPQHNMFYRVEDGSFILNEITSDVLFKNRADALAVAKAAQGRRKKKRADFSLQAIAVRKTKKGVRVLEKVVSRWNSRKKWKPKLRK